MNGITFGIHLALFILLMRKLLIFCMLNLFSTLLNVFISSMNFLVESLGSHKTSHLVRVRQIVGQFDHN